MNRKTIQNQNSCLEGRGYVVLLQPCSYIREQKWEHAADYTIKHLNSQQCLSSSRNRLELILEPCDSKSSNQLWTTTFSKSTNT